jgi:hypothetical protein
MSLILEAWDMTKSFVSLASRKINLRQYLQVDLENDEEIYKGDISTFVVKVSSMNEFRRGIVLCIPHKETQSMLNKKNKVFKINIG